MRQLRATMAPLILAAATALVAFAPVAHAQSSTEIHARMDQIAERIDRNEARGRLGHRDARELREELRSIRESEERMRRDGRLDPRERQMLERRLSRVDARVSAERR